METNVKLEQVKKSCNVAEKVMLVLSIFMIVGVVIALGASLFMVVNRASLNVQLLAASESGTLDIPGRIELSRGMLQFSFLTDNMIANGMYAEAIAVVCLGAALMCLVGVVIFRIVYNTFREINRNESPFEEGILKKLKVTFIIITVYFVLTNGIGIGLCVGVVLWSVYCIFDYGSILQKQYDETL